MVFRTKERSTDCLIHGFGTTSFAISSARLVRRYTAKPPPELLAMAAEISAEAERNQVIADQERLERQRALVRKRISELEEQLPALKAEVDAAEAAKAKRREEVKGDLAILDGLQITLDGQVPEYKDGYLRSNLNLTFTNETGHIVHHARYGFDWTYLDCGGSRYMMLNLRFSKTPLMPKGSASITDRTGLGWVSKSVKDDESGQYCDVEAAKDFRVTRVLTSHVTFDNPPRAVDRLAIQRDLDRLEAAIDSRRDMVASMVERIEKKAAELAAI